MKPWQNIENFTISFRFFNSFVNASMPSVTMCGTKSRHNGSENTLVCVSLSAWRVVIYCHPSSWVARQSPEGKGGGRQNYLDSSRGNSPSPSPSLLTPATMQARIGTFHSRIYKFFLFFPLLCLKPTSAHSASVQGPVNLNGDVKQRKQSSQHNRT